MKKLNQASLDKITAIVEKHKGAAKRIVALVMPFVLSAGIISGYCYMNYIHYGRFIVSDFTSEDFTKAYGALMSIEHEDSLMSSSEGLTKAIAALKDVLIFEDKGEMFWA